MNFIQLDNQGYQSPVFSRNPGLIFMGDEGFIPFVREEETSGFYLMPCMPSSFEDPGVWSEEIFNLNYVVDDGRFEYTSKLMTEWWWCVSKAVSTEVYGTSSDDDWSSNSSWLDSTEAFLLFSRVAWDWPLGHRDVFRGLTITDRVGRSPDSCIKPDQVPHRWSCWQIWQID
jgi:hypothetical protein